MLILKAKTREELVKQIADWLMDQYKQGDAWCRLEAGDDDNESNTCANVDGVINLNTLVDHLLEPRETGENEMVHVYMKKTSGHRSQTVCVSPGLPRYQAERLVYALSESNPTEGTTYHMVSVSGESADTTPRESRGEGGYPIPRNPGTNRV